MDKKVSIIVPVYNTEKYLTKCLESLVNQTLKEIEIIIINDGSKDNSEKIIMNYIDKYSDKIKYIYQENSGQAVARNKGIQMAKGEYIAFVDSDDYVDERTYEILWNEAKEKDYDILCFNLYEDIDGNIRRAMVYNTENDDMVKKYITSEASPCNKIIKTCILRDNNLGFLEGHIYEDFALVPRLALYTNKIGYIDKCLYYYVIHSNSTMRQECFNQKLMDIFLVLEYLYDAFSETEYIEELEYLYIEHLLHSASLRFLKYKEGIEQIQKIARIMKQKFPKWEKNKYYRKQNIKYKIICELLYYKKIFLAKKLLRIK